MHIPKRYGESHVDRCPFCKRQATIKNEQGIPVCIEHKGSRAEGLKCVCGRALELRQGKFGVFFNCLECGNINKSRVFEINDLCSDQMSKDTRIENNAGFSRSGTGLSSSIERKAIAREKPKREITIRSDDPLYFD